MNIRLAIASFIIGIFSSSQAWAFHPVNCQSQDHKTEVQMLVDAPGNVISAALTFNGESFSYALESDGQPPIFIGKGRMAILPFPPLTIEISPDVSTAELLNADPTVLARLACQ